MNDVSKVEQGKQNPDDDRSNNGGHHEQQHRLGHRNQHAELAIQIRFVADGHAKQLSLVETAGFLRDGDHFHHRRWKEQWTLRQTLGKRLAALHLLDGAQETVSDNV